MKVIGLRGFRPIVGIAALAVALCMSAVAFAADLGEEDVNKAVAATISHVPGRPTMIDSRKTRFSKSSRMAMVICMAVPKVPNGRTLQYTREERHGSGDDEFPNPV